MSQPTKRYKKTLGGSLGAGMKSLMGSANKKYFILEHKVNSKYHKAGENQEIIVDQVEIGRSSTCAVRIEGDAPMFDVVSRKHAAIVKDGQNWKLVHLSQTNSTYLNGHKVGKEWYLQNGDEIQLATNGPKLGFIIPSGKKSTIGSIGLTRRLSLFRQQALRPYKTAIAVLACLLLLLSSGGGYKLWDLHNQNMRLEADAEKSKQEIQHLAVINDSIAKEVVAKGETISEMQKQITILKDRKPQIINKTITKVVRVPSPDSKHDIDNDAINRCLPNIFYIQTLGFEITTPDGKRTTVECGSGENQLPGWSGTGFILSDGRFITARHVTEGWYFFVSGGQVNKNLLMLNAIANNGGKVVALFGAVSSSGTKLTFRSDQFTCNRSHDRENHTEDGTKVVMANLDNTDYAYFRASQSGGLKYDSSKSSNLERGTKLTVLGFPLGLGANGINDINPIYGSGIVAANGLQNGVILTTDTNYEQGNSGGPVFYTDENGDLVVVGIVSAGAGRNTGFVVPLSSLR